MKSNLTLSVAAILFGLGTSAAWAQSPPLKLRFGHAHPTSDSQHVAALEFAKKVKERTQGAIEVQFFPSNQLGNDNTMIAGVRGGTIDIAMSGNPYFTGIEPKLNVLDLPYLFDHMTHVAKVLDDRRPAHQLPGARPGDGRGIGRTRRAGAQRDLVRERARLLSNRAAAAIMLNRRNRQC